MRDQHQRVVVQGANDRPQRTFVGWWVSMEHYVRQSDNRWLLAEADQGHDSVSLASMDGRLALPAVYQTVDLPAAVCHHAANLVTFLDKENRRMATTKSHVYAGSAHWTSSGDKKNPGGLYRMTVGENRWEALTQGLPETFEVRAIAIHPQNAQVIYAGTNNGPYRSSDGGDHWEKLPFPDPAMVVWSIEFDPTNPQTMYLGTAPALVYRTDNGGDSWRRLSARQPERVQMGFDSRLIRLAVDPSNPNEIYAGVEVGGVMRSLDGGETWSDCSQGIIDLAELPHLKSKIGSDTETEGMLDTHALVVTKAQPGTVFLAVRMGLFRGSHQGQEWEDMQVGRFSPLTYARDIQVSPQDPRVLYACLSPAARSRDGSLYRSDDVGQTWKRIDHGVKAESTMMSVALHRTDPNQIYCNSRGGQVFGTQDGGASWHEYPLPSSIQDVYAVACA